MSQTVSYDKFKNSVGDDLSKERRLRRLLDYSNPYEFVLSFIDTLEADKIPVMLPNNMPGTRKLFSEAYDEVCTKTFTRNIPSHLNLLDFPQNSEVIFYTSGSTGNPKKIKKTLSQLHKELLVIEETFGKPLQSFNIYSTVSQQHIYGFLFFVLWPLITGRKVNLNLVRFPEHLLGISEPYVLISSPAFLKRLGLPSGKSHYCKDIISSGGLLTQEIAEQVRNIFGFFPNEILGSTETGGVAIRKQDEKNPQGLWNCLKGIEVIKNNKNLLEIKSPFLHESSFVMEDQIEFISASKFNLLNRADRIVKIEDKRVSLTCIENQLLEHTCVSESYAFSSDNGRQQILCVIGLSQKGLEYLNTKGSKCLTQKLRQHLMEYNDVVVLPKRFRYVKEILKNTQSKIEFSYLKEMFNEL